jgi:ABC-type nitrate/sulfonate/bicarbonate transport system substrate-binding protein
LFYFAAAEAGGNARVLADGTGLVPNHQFYLSSKSFAAENGPALDAIVAAVAEGDALLLLRHRLVERADAVGLALEGDAQDRRRDADGGAQFLGHRVGVVLGR